MVLVQQRFLIWTVQNLDKIGAMGGQLDGSIRVELFGKVGLVPYDTMQTGVVVEKNQNGFPGIEVLLKFLRAGSASVSITGSTFPLVYTSKISSTALHCQSQR